jgi:hypothetical protein
MNLLINMRFDTGQALLRWSKCDVLAIAVHDRNYVAIIEEYCRFYFVIILPHSQPLLHELFVPAPKSARQK